ncbi:hypothetical protein [Stenotrophomonas sp. TWI1183]|uniref:hypothetical protein n=1 Tax=Stenotrophomonas sp. TWI1183 TaxID=3136799 RepID=UPI00320863DE
MPITKILHLSRRTLIPTLLIYQISGQPSDVITRRSEFCSEILEKLLSAAPLVDGGNRNRNDYCKEGYESSYPRPQCSNGVPPNNAIVYAELIASKHPLQPNHTVPPLRTGRHFATSHELSDAPTTLSTVKPPRELRTYLAIEEEQCPSV